MANRGSPCFFTTILPASSTAGEAPLGRRGAHVLRETFQPQEKFSPGHDRCGGDGEVGFRFGALLEHDSPSFFLKGIEDQPFIPKLIGDGTFTRYALKQGFKCLGVSPGEQPVQVFDLRIELVVFLGSDDDHAVRTNRLDIRGKFEDAAV